MSSRYIFIPIMLFTLFSLLFLRCSSEKTTIKPLGEIHYPEDNRFDAEKAELGRKLFFDARLSLDSSISCASCHEPKWAFTDRRKLPLGVEGRLGFRNAPTLLNVAYQKKLMFDAEVPDLEQQAIVPIQDHQEMAISVGDLVKRLRKVEEYQREAKKIFKRDFDAWVLTRSLAAFERTLISDNSRFDRYYYGNEDDALSAEEKEGWRIFSEKLYCTGCHPPPYFTSFTAENNGLYEDYGTDPGRFRINFDSTEMGSFKVPTLRNIELTYPYMHDGSMMTLEEVLNHYGKGGLNNPNKSNKIKAFKMTDPERKNLLAFLMALTDTSYLERLKN